MAITKISPSVVDFDAGITISTADNLDTLTLTSTDADANAGPNLRLYRNSGSPADNDALGLIEFEGRNDNTQDVVYAGIDSRIVDASDGTEDGRLEIVTMLAGTAGTSRILMDATETVFNDNSKDLDFRVETDGNANAFVINGSTNNVAIGSVGMACLSSYTQLSIGPMAHIMAENTSGTGRSLHISQNAHLDTDSSWETMETDAASNYYQYAGAHYWRTAGSTSAGTDITWVNAMNLGSGGHLSVGNNSRNDDCVYLYRSGTGKLLRFYGGGSEVGYISTNTYSLPSDRNFKKDIEALTLGLDFVKDLKPKQYRQKIDDSDVPLQTGLIAQDVEESLTAAGVSKNKYMMLQHTPDEDENASQYGIDYGKIIPVLINAIKEQQTLIETLTTKVKALEEA